MFKEDACGAFTDHGFLGVFVVWVPANAHDHFVDVAVAHGGPAVIDRSWTQPPPQL